jgi:hypothetical protein
VMCNRMSASFAVDCRARCECARTPSMSESKSPVFCPYLICHHSLVHSTCGDTKAVYNEEQAVVCASHEHQLTILLNDFTISL